MLAPTPKEVQVGRLKTFR